VQIAVGHFVPQVLRHAVAPMGIDASSVSLSTKNARRLGTIETCG
jgi:hypothetical protein